jgi:hypothetical protein
VFASVSFTLGDDGMLSARNYLQDAQEALKESATHPPGSVYVGEYSSKMLIAKPVISPDNMPEDLKRNETLRLVHDMLLQGVHVYGLQSYDRTYRDWIRQDARNVVDDPEGASFWEARLRTGGAG